MNALLSKIPLESMRPGRRLAVVGLTMLVLDSAFFGLTNPARLPAALLIVGFVLLGVSLYILLRLVGVVAQAYGLKQAGQVHRLALIVSVTVMIAIALQSLGELTPRDVVVLGLLSLIAYAYLSYGRDKSRRS